MKSVLYVFATALIATPVLTIAQPTAPEPLSVRVNFADLDTSTFSGAAALFARLKAASRSVCRNFEDSRLQEMIVRHADCVGKALENAVADVNRPQLTAYGLAHGVQVGRADNHLARRE